jgi:glycosyltransferase involved in cell wall biosynthesis
MRLLFVADGRSPIALNWISFFLEQGHEVHLASTSSCQPDPRLASYSFIPVAFSQASARLMNQQFLPPGGFRSPSALRLRTFLRDWLGPVTLRRASRNLRTLIQQIQPDLLHAMRIPYEGILTFLAQPRSPLLISVWGNDFTLHATANPWLTHYTRKALTRADALHTDCQRDLHLARAWGYSSTKPAIVLPGAGGVQLSLFYPLSREDALTAANQPPIVINPRGFRAYVQNQAFFEAVALVLQRHPGVRFLCPAMEGERQALRWLHALGIASSVELLPPQTPSQMADLFRRSLISVSPTTHDGTPNTLLEAMACGCFPIAGDLESIREWIIHGQNGLLVDSRDPQALANAIVNALDDRELRKNAMMINQTIIAAKADYSRVMPAALDFYRSLCSARR